jgi:exonuclease III
MMPFLMVSLSSAHLVLLLIHHPLQMWVAAQDFLLVSLPLLSTLTPVFKSFELSAVMIKHPLSNLALYIIYHPPQSSVKSRLSSTFSQFLEDFKTLISSFSTSHEFFITGDFNIHVDDQSDSNDTQFFSLLNHANLAQHVNFPIDFLTFSS